MIMDKESVCSSCGGNLKYYDSVKRIVRTKNGHTSWIKVRRMRCVSCRELHRNLPDFLFPFKQYESEIIIGVLEGLISCETLGFEDYPCEMTMKRWKNSTKLKVLTSFCDDTSSIKTHRVCFNKQ